MANYKYTICFCTIIP